MWDIFGNTVDNAFYFVVDKIIDLQGFFINTAWGIGYVVLLIAILSAALNYALTGQGLKENIVKIMKATIFFLIIIFAYPRIISFITSYTFSLAQGSIYPSIAEYFGEVVGEKPIEGHPVVITNPEIVDGSTSKFFYSYKKQITKDEGGLFLDLQHTQENPKMSYTTVAPAAVIKIIFFIAGECIRYADEKEGIIPEFSRVLKGLICAFFAILTGIFALLEYLICFLEFMLVASVGIILFPLSIWEGSKFMSEKFIGAILGFFVKLLFCNLAIFLLLYGFISIFYNTTTNGFKGTVDQIIFIIFSCLLFFYICKSAPGLAQSLLTGTPSLSATGAISAVGGAIAAAGATMGMAKSIGGAGKTLAGGVAKTGAAGVGSLMEAGAASAAAKGAGGSGKQQFGAFMSSLGSDAVSGLKATGLGLARSLLGSGSGGSGGGGVNPHSWRDSFLQGSMGEDGKLIEPKSLSIKQFNQLRDQEGADRGRKYMAKKEGNQTT